MTTATTMKTDEELKELAIDLFVEAHRRIGHGNYATRESFNDNPHRRAAWFEIARALDERFVPNGRWLEDYVGALYTRVHARLGDHDRLDLAFASPPIQAAWRVFARLVEERLNTSSGERVLIVGDGERWFVRRVLTVINDVSVEHDHMVYRCDAALGGPYNDPTEALSRALTALRPEGV